MMLMLMMNEKSKLLLTLAILTGCISCLLGASVQAEPTGSESARSEDAGRVLVGRVVSTRGAVFAQSPGEERRILSCRDPVYDGDHVLTLDASDVGIDAGSYHVRVGEKSSAELGQLSSGAPRVDLAEGHVRLIDSAEGAGALAELTTPGLRLARTGRDQDALVFSEKAGVVSMVCAYSEPLDIASRLDPSVFLSAPSGSCVVAKPREALFSADASHPKLAVLMRDACGSLAALPVAGFFSPAAVGLGPGLLAAQGPAPPVALFNAGQCVGGCVASPQSGGPPGPAFPPLVAGTFPFGFPVAPTP